MITKWIKTALKDKAKEIISEGLDLGLGYLKNQLVTTIYPTFSGTSNLIDLITNHCEELYIIDYKGTIQNKNNKSQIFGDAYYDKDYIFDGIFRIKNTNLIFRFTRNRKNTEAPITKFTTWFTVSEIVEKTLSDLCKTYRTEQIFIEIMPQKNSRSSLVLLRSKFEQDYVKPLFYNTDVYTKQIEKHLIKNSNCVVLLYGIPGNQKSTYIKHLINEFIIKEKSYFYNNIIVHNIIPATVDYGFHIIEDVDRLLTHQTNIKYKERDKEEYFLNLPEFLNSLDGSSSFLEENKKRLIIMTANDINNLPDALLNRRFDLQIRFDNPPKTKWLEILNTYLKPDYSNIVIEELKTLEISDIDNPFSVSLLLKLAKNLEFLDLEDKEIFKNSVLVEYNKLNVI